MAIFFSKDKFWDQLKIQDWLRLHPDYMTPAPAQPPASNAGTVEGFLKQSSEPMIRVSEAVRLIEQVLPSPLVQRSWSLGPQRMCQELRRVVLRLQSHKVTASS
jgi:hypothetical protein